MIIYSKRNSEACAEAINLSVVFVIHISFTEFI